MTCPCCGTEFPWPSGLIEADAKRLGAILGAMEPALARAAMEYLRFFKPAKSSLRIGRAIKLLQELTALVSDGAVSRPDRAVFLRAAPPSVWVAAIEQMQQQADRLTLPLTGHGYLRQVAFGIAEAAGATAEKQREQTLRTDCGPTTTRRPASVADRLMDELRFISQMREYGQIDEAEADRRATAARERLGEQP